MHQHQEGHAYEYVLEMYSTTPNVFNNSNCLAVSSQSSQQVSRRLRVSIASRLLVGASAAPGARPSLPPAPPPRARAGRSPEARSAGAARRRLPGRGDAGPGGAARPGRPRPSAGAARGEHRRRVCGDPLSVR